MKTLKLPLIQGLENMESVAFAAAMEKDAAKGYVDTVNWPEAFPYAPDVRFFAARSEKSLAVLYKVDGLDLRAVAMEDNGRVWEDSCCEFFFSHPDNGCYYNFEMNCAGTLLAARRTSRQDADHFSAEKLARVLRHSSLGHKACEIEGEVEPWSVAMVIPFELMDLDPEMLPASIRANFYKCGDLTAHVHFLSWNPIDTPDPDFHRPEFFGLLEF